MCVGSTCGGAETGDCRGLQALLMWQSLLPFVPNAVLPDGQASILLQPCAALPLYGSFPFGQQLRGIAVDLLLDNHAEHVEVVHLTQNILKLLQVWAPRLILLRKQAFDRVAKFLQTDAKPVPGGRLVGLQRPAMQFLCFHQPLDSQALRSEASGWDQANPLTQLAFQSLPDLLVKFAGQPKRLLQ